MADIKISIEAARRNIGLTQKQVADRLGVSNQTICGWEKEPNRIPIEMAYKLSKLYKMAMENLIFVPEDYD